MEHEVLIKEISDHIGTLKLNRPDQRNALSPGLLADLHLTLKKWAEDDAVRAVVITGNDEKAFSSGYDIAAIPTGLSPEAAEVLKTGNPLELALNSIRHFPYPVIAMINGYCFGAGLNLAMCCDIRIGADHIKVGMPPVKLGVVYHPEGLSQFIEVIGMARTREIFLTGNTYSGNQVREMGLVNHLVPAQSLPETVYTMAREISKNAPLAVKGTKRVLNMFGRHLRLSPEEMKEAETLIAETFNSDDLVEGQTAFLEKRMPVFKGE